jgi:hypothetical protein
MQIAALLAASVFGHVLWKIFLQIAPSAIL